MAYRVANVTVGKANLSESDFMKVLNLRFDGKLLVNSEEVFDNWLIFIEAFNGEIWGGGQDYLLDLSILKPAESLARFKSAV